MAFRTEVVLDMPASEYFSDPCDQPSLSQSMALTLCTQSPQHAWLLHPRLGGQSRKVTRAMDEGSLVDCLLLGNHKGYTTIEADSYRTKAAQEARDAARANGTTPVLIGDFVEAQATANAVRARLTAAGVPLSGKSQVALFWTETADDGTVVQCRGLLDHLQLPTVFDLKKTKSAAPKDLARHCERYGYDIQAAAYIAGVSACIPDLRGRVGFQWLFCEAHEPYAVTRATPAGSMLELGRSRWMRAINIFARCMNTGEWPGYEAAGVYRVEASQWALQDAAFDREDEDGQAA